MVTIYLICISFSNAIRSPSNHYSYYLMASPEIPTVTQNSESSCKTLSSMDFQECNINTQLSFELSRRFLEESLVEVEDDDTFPSAQGDEDVVGGGFH